MLALTCFVSGFVVMWAGVWAWDAIKFRRRRKALRENLDAAIRAQSQLDIAGQERSIEEARRIWER